MELGKLVEDQDAYATTARQLLTDLDMDLGESEEGEQSENSEGESENAEENEGESEGGEGKASGSEGSLEGGVPEQDKDGNDEGGAEEVAGEMMPGTGDDDPGRPGRPGILPRRQASTTILRSIVPSPPTSTRWSTPTSCATPTS